VQTITRPGTATAFPLRLRLHYKAARAGGVNCQGGNVLKLYKFSSSEKSYWETWEMKVLAPFIGERLVLEAIKRSKGLSIQKA
jgi:hypothetical protein